MTLIERIEAAEGPSRELDLEVAYAVDWRWEDWEDGDPTVRGHVDKHGFDWMLARLNQSVTVWPRLLPQYTASLDAAMSLVGDNVWKAGDDDMGGPFGVVGDELVYAATPALALCAAALKARAE